MKPRILSVVTIAALAACGGGGSGGTAPAASIATPLEATAAASPPPPSAAAPAQLGDCEMFPPSAIFNTRIDALPAHANSNAWIALVGGGTQLMPNWGNSSDPTHTWDYWGMPINVIDVSGSAWPIVNYWNGYPDKSDCATAWGGSSIVADCSGVPATARRFPFPAGQVLTEGNDDRHVLVIDRSACRLWEAFGAKSVGDGQWNAVSTATWELRSNALRPDGWGSADAAGLPIAPLLAKASEAATGEIRHAMRVTFRNQFTSVNHVWPARYAVGLEDPQNIPFGSLLRLKADFPVPDNWSPQAKAVANAFKRYGVYVADNGQDFFVQGEPNDAWDPAAWQQLRSITLQNMEFVDLVAVTRDPRFNKDSMQAAW